MKNKPYKSFLIISFISLTLTTATDAITTRLETSHTNAYRGQVIKLSLVIETQDTDTANPELLGMPSADIIQIEKFNEKPVDHNQIDGKIIQIRRFETMAMPIKTGRINLSPKLRIRLIKVRRSRFGTTRSSATRVIPVKPVTLNVRSIPATNSQPDYTGIVGSFSFDVGAHPTNVVPGQLIEITADIHGTGNLENAEVKLIEEAAKFKVYEPRIVKEEKWRRLVLKQTVVPQSSEADSIPAVNFSFFDPVAEKHTTLTRGPFHPNYIDETEELTSSTASQTGQVEFYHDNSAASAKKSGGGKVARFYRALSLSLYWAVAIILVLLASAFLKRRWPLSLLILILALLIFPAYRNLVPGFLIQPDITLTVSAPTGAHLCPADSSLVTFQINPGDPVHVISSVSGWSKISSGNRRGWLPTLSLKTLK